MARAACAWGREEWCRLRETLRQRHAKDRGQTDIHSTYIHTHRSVIGKAPLVPHGVVVHQRQIVGLNRCFVDLDNALGCEGCEGGTRLQGNKRCKGTRAARGARGCTGSVGYKGSVRGGRAQKGNGSMHWHQRNGSRAQWVKSASVEWSVDGTWGRSGGAVYKDSCR
jgi:hypothetical protein